VVCEMFGYAQGGRAHFIGCVVVGCFGALWPLIWQGDAKMWLAIMVSTFGMILLPIAYVTFFFMMNSKGLMKEEKPTGNAMVLWNVLMGISCIGASVAAFMAVKGKMAHDIVGPVVVGLVIGFIVLTLVGFALKKKGGTSDV
jgi:hypothetical protein